MRKYWVNYGTFSFMMLGINEYLVALQATEMLKLTYSYSEEDRYGGHKIYNKEGILTLYIVEVGIVT